MDGSTEGYGWASESAAEGKLVDLTAIALDDLPHLSRDQMGQLWWALLQTPVPKSLSLALMQRFVAFELQARDRGGLPKGFVEGLARSVGYAGRGKVTPTRLRPGGRLLREWNGITHVVDIVEGGFVWRGNTYGSLSAIAKEITGTHWSGPRFFGMTSPTTVSSKTKAASTSASTTRVAR
jgi:hypothetical protein